MKFAWGIPVCLVAFALLETAKGFVVPAPAGLARASAARAASSASGPRMMLPFAGAALSHLINSAPLNPDRLMSANKQPTHLVAYKETREGIYGPYEVEVDPNYKKEVEMADSTFKSKEETEVGRDKYVSVLAVLLAGSFVIPMVQYWWYIRDDDRPIE